MGFTDKKVLESAPFAYFQLKITNNNSFNDKTVEILFVNKPFEMLIREKRTHFINQKYADLPLSLKRIGLEKVVDFIKNSYVKELHNFEYFSEFTKCLYKTQVWSSEKDTFHCMFTQIVDHDRWDENSNDHLKRYENETITKDSVKTLNNYPTTLFEPEQQKVEKHLILDSIPDMVVYHDTNMNVLWANKSATEKIGQPLQKIMDTPCYKSYFQNDEKCHHCPVEKTIKTHQRFSLLKERSDGTICDVLSTPVLDDHGQLTGVLETIKDVTQEKLAEQEIRKREEKYRRLTEKTEIIIWEYDMLLDRWTHVSPQVMKILGYHPEEWTDYNFWVQRIHPEDREWAARYCSDLTAKGINHVFEYRFRKKDGTYIWVSDDVNVELQEGKLIKMWGSLRNITQQKLAEQALRASEEKLSTTLHSIGDGVITTDVNGMIESMNPVAENMCGCKLKDVKGKPLQEIFRIVNSGTRKALVNPVKKVLETGKIIGLANHTVLISEDGEERQIADSAAPIRNKEGEIQGVVLVFSDVTENYNKQNKIRESEEKFRLLITQMEQGIAVHEAVYSKDGKMTDYRFIDVNMSFEKMTGLKREDILGKTVLEVLPDTEPYWIEQYASVVKTGKAVKFENYAREFDKYFEVLAYKTRWHQFALMISDITERKMFEEKIKTSDKIFHHSIDMLCMAGFDGYFKVINPSWSRVLGWSEEELLTKPWIEFVHPEDRLNTVNIKSKLDKGVEVYQFENRYICKDNTVKWLSWNSFPYPEENIMFGVARDITFQKKSESILRSNEEKYRLLFQNSPLGIIHINSEGVLVSYNEQLIKILGSAKKYIKGINLLKLPDKNIVKVVKKVLEGKHVNYEGDYTTVKGKKTTPIRIIASPVFADDGNIEGGMLLIEDHTDQIQKRNLQRKVAVAEESVKFKQRFLANMSHEIRTPLTGILGMVEILEQTSLTSTQLDYLKTLKYSGENLREIINLILDFSKIEAGKVQLKKKTFEFDKLFVLAKTLFQSICNKPIVFETTIDPDIPDHILADETRLLQIINNLISNAVKFTDEGKISMEANLVSDHSDHVKIKISISDNGLGIPLEKQKYLFSPFTQVDQSDSRAFEGTGLGLSICKELAKLHGGEIGLESKVGQGSKFWFTFNAHKSEKKPEIANNKTNTPTVATRTKNILLAEDKIVNQKVFRIMLASLGHEITMVNNGLEFLEAYKPGLYDIVFMDIQMPVMDGLTAVKKIREKYKELPPIVGLSANAFEGDREKYMAMGLDEYLIKPVKRDDFSRVMTKLFENG